MKDADWLTPEWMQYGQDALKASLDVNSDMKRQMVEFLLDSGLWDRSKLSYDSALGRFNACLNPAQPEFFRGPHLWALMRRFDRHALFLAMAEDLGYEVRKKPTEERRQELMERLLAALEDNTRIAGLAQDTLARFEQVGAQLHVHPAFRRGTSDKGGW